LVIGGNAAEKVYLTGPSLRERDMSHVYGPVPSRRLGQSLGIDPIPFKRCNYNCVYCQLGRTAPLTNERQEFFPPEEILAEMRLTLQTYRSDQIDYITFVGQGEPLLCASLGRLIRGVKALTGIPVAIITNGSLLFTPEVRAELIAAEVVIPTLDAADEETFRRINRPWPELQIAEMIEGLVAFRKMFEGQLWVEVMLVKGINDTEQALSGIAEALSCIRPDQVHLNVPIRPPAEEWVEPPDDDGLIRAMAILGEVATIVTPAEGTFELEKDMPMVDAIIDIIRRHPMREAKLVETLTRYADGPDDVHTTLEMLAASGRARQHVYRGQAFWEYAGGRFATSHKDSRKK
jgi:wyosine [tRNA(Phe)-imidazoG37] synthetase (radical SAM superfamily)